MPATITVSPAIWPHVTKSEWRKRIHHFLSCSFLENGWVRGPEKNKRNRKLSEMKGYLSQLISWRPSLSFMPQPHLSSFSDTEKYSQSAIQVYNNEDMAPPSMFILTAWRQLWEKKRKTQDDFVFCVTHCGCQHIKEIIQFDSLVNQRWISLQRVTFSGLKRPSSATASQIALSVSAPVCAVDVRDGPALPNIVIVNRNPRGRSSRHLMMIRTEVAAAAAGGISN